MYVCTGQRQFIFCVGLHWENMQTPIILDVYTWTNKSQFIYNKILLTYCCLTLLIFFDCETGQTIFLKIFRQIKQELNRIILYKA